MDKIRVGIIGCGRIADMHVKGYFGRDDAKITAISDLSEVTRQRRAQEWGVEKTYENYQDLLNDKEIDLVEILTPHHLHCAMVCEAAKAKKHISVQKPMAMNAAECDEMINACFYAGVQLKVYENFVFYPPFVMAKNLIAQGEIGEVLTARFKLGSLSGGWRVPLTAWLWRLDKKSCGPGPTLFDDGYHKFSMATDLFGQVASVKAWVDYTLATIDSPAMVAMTFRDHPAIAYFETSFSPNMTMRSKYYGADERVEITGTRGTILMTRCSGKLFDEPALILYRDGRTIGFEDLRSDWADSFIDSTVHYLDAIKNFRSPKLSGSMGKHILQTAFAAYISSRDGQRIDPETVTGEELNEE